MTIGEGGGEREREACTRTETKKEMRGLKSGREREVETNGADEHISRFFPPTAFILAGRFVALLDLLSGNALLLQRSFRDVYCFPIRVPARIFVLK